MVLALLERQRRELANDLRGVGTRWSSGVYCKVQKFNSACFQ